MKSEMLIMVSFKYMTCWKLPIVVRILICMHSKLSCIRACCIGWFVKFFCLLILRFLVLVISHNSDACFFFLVVFKSLPVIQFPTLQIRLTRYTFQLALCSISDKLSTIQHIRTDIRARIVDVDQLRNKVLANYMAVLESLTIHMPTALILAAFLSSILMCIPKQHRYNENKLLGASISLYMN
jgi:hypothetical protein